MFKRETITWNLESPIEKKTYPSIADLFRQYLETPSLEYIIEIDEQLREGILEDDTEDSAGSTKMDGKLYYMLALCSILKNRVSWFSQVSIGKYRYAQGYFKQAVSLGFNESQSAMIQKDLSSIIDVSNQLHKSNTDTSQTLFLSNRNKYRALHKSIQKNTIELLHGFLERNEEANAADQTKDQSPARDNKSLR